MTAEVLNLDEALERVMDDQDFLKELFKIFQEDYLSKRQQIEELFTERNFGELQNIAHSLKGASSNISAIKINLSFSLLEQIARSAEVDEIQELLDTIDQQYEELRAHIDRIVVEM